MQEVRSSIGTVYMSRLGTPYIIITNPANGDTAFTSSVQVDYAAEGNRMSGPYQSDSQ
ncbi:MAG: hypothetical protein R3B93_16175 [Bacteroidia bacterium]